MSGCNYGENCPNCGGVESLMISEETSPHAIVCGECVECGYSFYTRGGFLDLETLNDLRFDFDLPALKKLPKQDKKWIF